MGGPAQGQSHDMTPQLSVTVDRSVNSGWSGGGRERDRVGGCPEELWGRGWHPAHHPWSSGHHSSKTPAGAHPLQSVPPSLQPHLQLPQSRGLAMLRHSLTDARVGLLGGMDPDKWTERGQTQQYKGENSMVVGGISALGGSWRCGVSSPFLLASGALPSHI